MHNSLRKLVKNCRHLITSYVYIHIKWILHFEKNSTWGLRTRIYAHFKLPGLTFIVTVSLFKFSTGFWLEIIQCLPVKLSWTELNNYLPLCQLIENLYFLFAFMFSRVDYLHGLISFHSSIEIVIGTLTGYCHSL